MIRNRELLKITIGTVVAIFLNSCIGGMNTQVDSKAKEKIESNLKLSNSGEYKYAILVDKNTEKFYKRVVPNERYDENRYEAILVFTKGAYPSFEPSQIAKHKNSIFNADIFGSIKVKGNNTTVLKTTDFDKKKFLKVANRAIVKMKEIEAEKYKDIKFDIEFNIASSIYEEYATVTVLIHRKPSLKLKKAIFYINQSAMYADLLSSVEVSPILQKNTYKLGLPTGKNIVKLSLSTVKGEEVHKSRSVENLFKGKPTFHIVAIGIDKFPKWGIDRRLKNAVNDAEYIKKVFKRRSSKLFRDRVMIEPYTLNYESTTKDSIRKLIERVRKNVKPNDYFLLYVASHGIIKGDGADKKYYFAPSDFSIDSKYWSFKNGFKENEISEYLINIPSIFRIAILDTCYAGKGVESIKDELRALPFSKKDGISILTATKSTQEANDNYQGHGLFTYVLAEGLNGKADYNKNGVVDSIEIAQYVQTNVSRVSRSQTKVIQDAMVLPDSTESYSRRFELTLLDRKKFVRFRPNIFTPRESQLYINAIREHDIGMMNGIIVNNVRHKNSKETETVDATKLSKEELTQKLITLSSVDMNIHFAVNSDELEAKEISKLEAISKALKDKSLKNKRIFVEGHTDWDGDELFNMDLSQRRANNVAELLNSEFGIESKRLTALGFGETYPIGDNETLEGRAKNRRVTIFIYE